MKLDSLMKLYVHELKDLYSAENQLLDFMPKMIEATNDEQLKKEIRSHMEQTKNHVARLEQIFHETEYSPQGQKCNAMEGLLKEANSLLSDKDISDDVLDAALIAAAQRVEHYEIAGYGVARTYAEKLGMFQAADLLDDTLNEEARADEKLTRLAERKINFEAMNS